MSRPVSKVTAVPDLPSEPDPTSTMPFGSVSEDTASTPSSADTADSSPADASAAENQPSGRSSEDAATATPTPEQRRSGMGVLALILGLLLLVSVAFNLKQSREIAVLDTRSQEFETALTAAVERIDSETLRAEKAEATLGGITNAVDTVHERIASLEEALGELREATAR